MTREKPDGGWWEPLGLLSLATYLKLDAKVKVEILSGEIMSLEEIEARIESACASFVCFSPTVLTYGICLDLARIAKRNRSKVIFGGHHATKIAERILANRPYVHAVVMFDGEEALSLIVKGNPLEDIPNVAFSGRDGIRKNPVKHADLDSLPSLDYSILDLERFFSNFRNYPVRLGYKRPLHISSHRGCNWRGRSGGCLFCARIEPFWRGKSPQALWSEIRDMRDQHGVDCVLDFGDDFLGNMDWFREVCDKRPDDIGVDFLSFFSRAEYIDEDIIPLLKKLRLFSIVIGIESGDDRCLKECRKGISAKRSLEVIKTLHKAGVRNHPSYLLGLPGEDDESIRKTIEHAAEVNRLGAVAMYCNILTPLPGSMAFDKLLSVPELEKKYGRTDILPALDMQIDWVKHFCEADYSELKRAQEKIASLNPVGIVEYTKN